MSRTESAETRLPAHLGEAFAQRSLLWLSVLLLNVLSIYTTARGVRLIAVEETFMSTVAVPWGLAIAVGCLLIYLTIEAGLSIVGVPRPWVLVGYLMIVTVSLFFNFNFFFSNMTAIGDERSVARTLEAARSSLLLHARSLAADSHGVPDLERALAAARAERDVEEERPDRPGQGSRWIPLMAEVKRLEEALAVSKQAAAADYAELERLAGEEEDASALEDYAAASATSARLRSSVSRLLAALESRYAEKIELTSEARDALLGRDVRSLSYSLDTVLTEVARLGQGEWDKGRSPRFLLALLMSALLDLPVFFAVFVTGASKRRSARAEQTISEDWRTDPELWDDIK